MKLYFLEFALWLYVNHIQEDWDDYNRLGKIMIYPAWFIRSTLVWLTFPLWLISFQFTRSKVYQHYLESGQAMTIEQQMELIRKQKAYNQNQTRNFLSNRMSNKNFNKVKK